MARLLAIFALCLHTLLAIGAEAAGEPIAIPTLKARVTDLTGSLTPPQVAELEGKLAAFEGRKGSQVVVLVLPTIQPETIEAFGIRLLDAWKVGRKGVDDSAILIVAKDDHRLRIEVGYGLEGVLNDALAKRIIEEFITPRFKADDFFGGIEAGVDAILSLVEYDRLPDSTPPDSNTSSPAVAASIAGDGILDFDSIGENTFLFGLAFLAIGGAVLRHFLGNLLGSGLVGGLTAGLGWLFTGTLVGSLIGAAAGFFIALFGLDLLLSGIFSGGSGGGGGGGGGGFSGGGGGGGGGGASGSW